MLRLRRDGMPLGTLVSFIKISSRSFIVDLKKPAFTLMVAVMIILTGVQTAGWSALITPRAIIVRTPLIGHEIDLSSALLREIQNNTALNDCFTSTSQPAFIVGQTESGYAVVKAFNRSTGGILPLTLSPLNSSTWFPGTKTLPATIKPEWDIPRGLISSYSLIQQGFAANVSCKLWDPAGATMPPISIQNTTVEAWNDTTVGGAIAPCRSNSIGFSSRPVLRVLLDYVSLKPPADHSFTQQISHCAAVTSV
ncbi:hypothetical protein DFH08DRAFT_963025 [Mycena albidolilacea]|uniref:Uncharacterized protein n=1 Tax=Mycena albidolilacea TaxID=1033008 RepID=A0AAD6ZWL8_9AGAR|nr:hypothetical protein DFH08DRAFT_963025 [Mycena albidolilacea]